MHAQKNFRFRISLKDIEPEIWRIIDVPYEYSFWGLHVAIQDSMGWLDCHMHEFRPRKKSPTDGKMIGIPDEFDVLPGWEVPIKKYFTSLGNSIDYIYDFGDSWEHEITLTGMFLADKEDKVPLCLDGERACPPEDCGSVPGYYHLLEIVSDPDNDEYEEVADWLKAYGKKYWPYKPEYFSPKRIKFSDPDERWNHVFSSSHQ